MSIFEKVEEKFGPVLTGVFWLLLSLSAVLVFCAWVFLSLAYPPVFAAPILVCLWMAWVATK